MNRREFVKSVAAMPCVAVAGAVALAPAIHTTGYMRTVEPWNGIDHHPAHRRESMSASLQREQIDQYAQQYEVYPIYPMNADAWGQVMRTTDEIFGVGIPEMNRRALLASLA